jgi:hypothetical protein
MTVIRNFLILASVLLLAPAGQALAGDVWHGGGCPRLCVEWFDGCNTCSCGKGRINSCTEIVCRAHKRPRCLRWGF